MNSLTTKEKIDLLKYVRNSLLEDLDRHSFENGICHYAAKYTGYSIDLIKDSIPELLKYKPADVTNGYWFDLYKAGHEKRIEIINQTLFDLENSLQKKEIDKIYFKCKPENILLNETTNKTYYYYGSDFSLRFPMDFIKGNPDLFIVKTEEDILNDLFSDELYELKEYCKGKIPVEKNKRAYYTFVYRNDKIEIVYYTARLSGLDVVRFDSEEQAIMFLYNIEKKENQELRNYFINLLKN